MPPKKIAIVGYGKIAHDQHTPSIAETDGLELVATVSRRGEAPDGVASFTTLADLANSDIGVDAIAFCTPPDGRTKMAMAAADFGWDILLEKPPGSTAAEVAKLADYVYITGQILFTTWHSQYNAAVDTAATRLLNQTVISMRINWKEDVRKWHPGQDWIWQANGFGVFDAGINALSIATKIMPFALNVAAASLTIAANHQSPIAADIEFAGQIGATCSAHFDWREQGDECWQIAIATEQETLLLDKGGTELWVDGVKIIAEPSREYRHIYAHFARLLTQRQNHVDMAPLQLVEGAMTLGDRLSIPEFIS